MKVVNCGATGQPVAIRSAGVYVIYSRSIRVFVVLSSQEVCAYEKMSVMYSLYT